MLQPQNEHGERELSSASALVSSRKNVPLAISLSLSLPIETFARLVTSLNNGEDCSVTALANNG